MNNWFNIANSTNSRWAQLNPSWIVQWSVKTLPPNKVIDRVARVLQGMEDAADHFWIHAWNRMVDTSPSPLFNGSGPASDIMDYSNSDLAPLGGGINPYTRDPSTSIIRTVSSPKRIIIPPPILSPVAIKARDARFLSLTTEKGWVSFVQRFFMEQLSAKKAEEKYPIELYLSLEDILVTIFSLYCEKNNLIEFQDDQKQREAFLEIIQDSTSEMIRQYYVTNPTGHNIEKKIQSLGTGLLGFITARKLATPQQIQKYGSYIGYSPHSQISPFELSILRTIKQIEKIIQTAESSLANKNAAAANLTPEQRKTTHIPVFVPAYDPKLPTVLNFLKQNFSDLKHQKWDLYEISLGLYDLGKTINWAVLPKQKSFIKKSSLWANLLWRFLNIIPKK